MENLKLRAFRTIKAPMIAKIALDIRRPRKIPFTPILRIITKKIFNIIVSKVLLLIKRVKA